MEASCVWGGGETPALRDLVVEGRALLSGSAVGIISSWRRWISGNIREGDSIILLGSSGIHDNGFTLCRREIAPSLEKGLLTPLSDGVPFGEALYTPTIIYVKAMQACLDAGVDVHYAVNVTGHGWRKLMRAAQPFVYVMTKLPEPMPIFEFIQEKGMLDDENMWGEYNMGAGYALMVSQSESNLAVETLRRAGYSAWVGGTVQKDGNAKRVEIRPKNLVFHGESMAIR